MRRALKNVLKVLADRGGYHLAHTLPNGHGHACNGKYASIKTMWELEREGYVKHGEHENPPVMGWCITDAGRLALAEQEGNG